MSIDSCVWSGSQLRVEIQTCNRESTGVEIPKQLPDLEGIICDGETGAMQVGVPEAVFRLDPICRGETFR